MKGNTSRLGIILTAAGALGFSTIILFTRSIQGMPAANIMFFRALSSFLFFCALLPRHPETLQIHRYRPELGRLILQGICVGLTGMLYIEAVQHTTAANAVLLNNTSVVYVALLAPLLLKETRPRYTWLSVALALTGIACIANPAQLSWQLSAWRGLGAALLSGVTLSGTLLLSRRLHPHVSGLTQIWWSAGIAALLALPWAAQSAWPVVAANLPYLIGLGVLAQGIPYMLYFFGLRHTNAQTVSLVALLEPVGGILIGLLVYREIPNALGLVGIGLILGSIVLVSR